MKHYALTLGLVMGLLFGSRQLPAQQASDSYKHLPIVDVAESDKALNFATIYATQWAVYYATQREIIEKHGSFKNWRKNIVNPHFDNDNFDFNLYQHSAVGHYYYLFYRSRGYGRQSAFEWSMLSSLAFEFTIETLTERPSYQDMYQTPVFGSILGMGAEKLSLYFHSLNTWPSSVLGYILDPFTLLPSSRYQLGVGPVFSKNKAALSLTLEAEL